MKAIVLAGGKGTRLAPYTKVLPKPLMPIGDMPILEILLAEWAGSVESFAVGHLAGLMKHSFRMGGVWNEIFTALRNLGTTGARSYDRPERSWLRMAMCATWITKVISYHIKSAQLHHRNA
jgi:NDP-sugar pyrophosphorylase family protein